MHKRLIVIAQSVDENDDHRGFFIGWLKEFATHFDTVEVITVAMGVYTLPLNVHVHSLGKERGASKMLQAFRFYRFLFRFLPGSSGVFAHASPIFVLTSWPFTFLFRKKMVLWYLHRSVTIKLWLASWMSTIITADTRSLGIRGKHIVAVGHGIDVERFATGRDWSTIDQRPLHIITVGRLAPIKDFATVIRAVGILVQRGRPVHLRIVGRANVPEHHAYERQLRQLVQNEHLASVVTFTGAVPYRDMPEQYRWADVAVGATPLGGIDKALLEAMAAGCIPVTSNDVMRFSLEPYANQLLFVHGNEVQLADRLDGLSDSTAISTAMAQSVCRYHNLSTTIEKISNLL